MSYIKLFETKGLGQTQEVIQKTRRCYNGKGAIRPWGKTGQKVVTSENYSRDYQQPKQISKGKKQ
jgi:hypothetical protein